MLFIDRATCLSLLISDIFSGTASVFHFATEQDVRPSRSKRMKRCRGLRQGDIIIFTFQCALVARYLARPREYPHCVAV
jgi:hypothetical protein